MCLIKTKKFIPIEYYHSIFDIDYNKLYDNNIRLILTDLDNTLISYKDNIPTADLLLWKEELLKKGFEIIIVSNSHRKRVETFSHLMGLQYVYTSTKPLKRGYKKALKKAVGNYQKNQICSLGDQLLTDVYGSNRFGIKTFLIKAVDKKTEKFPTKFNRFIEKRILKKIRKKEPAQYSAKLEEYVSDIYESL